MAMAWVQPTSLTPVMGALWQRAGPLSGRLLHACEAPPSPEDAAAKTWAIEPMHVAFKCYSWLGTINVHDIISKCTAPLRIHIGCAALKNSILNVGKRWNKSTSAAFLLHAVKGRPQKAEAKT